MSTYRQNVCHKRRSDDESSESDGDQPSVKKLKSTERETSTVPFSLLYLKESFGKKCREAYAWLMDIPARKLFRERLMANEVVVILDDDSEKEKEKEPDIIEVGEIRKPEIQLCDLEDRENRPRVSCSTPYYTDGSLVGFKNRPTNGFHGKPKDYARKPQKQHRIVVDQRLTPVSNPGIDFQFMLDQPPVTFEDDELQVIQEIQAGKNTDWKRIRPGKRFMVPVIAPTSPIECITIESNGVPHSTVKSNGMTCDKITSPKNKAASTSKEGSVSFSKAYTALQVAKEQEKQQYKLLLEKMMKISMSRPVRKEAKPIEIDLTNESEEISWSRPYSRSILDKPLPEYRSNLYNPTEIAPSASFHTEPKAESLQIKDEEISIEDLRKSLGTPKFRLPKGKPDITNKEWVTEMKMILREETEKYMAVVKTQEHKMQRFRDRRAAKAEEEKLLHEKLKIPGDVISERPAKEDFPELTPDMEETIYDLLRTDNGPATELITRYDDVPLLRKEFRTLNDDAWLLDEVLNCYVKLLMDRSQLDNYPSMFAFNSFFFASLQRNPESRSIKRWSRDKDIFSYDLLCFVLNLEGVHWALCVVDNRDKTVKYYDSMAGHRHEHITFKIRNYLIMEKMNKKNIQMDVDEYTCIGVKGLPQQGNGSDCGMFTLKYAEYITRDAPINFNQTHIPYFRRRMVWELLNHQLL